MRPLRDPSLGVPMDLAEDELAAIREDAAAWRECMADESMSRVYPPVPAAVQDELDRQHDLRVVRYLASLYNTAAWNGESLYRVLELVAERDAALGRVRDGKA